MLAKRFFFACAGLLCLALAYHSGATRAGAQPGPVTAAGALPNASGGNVTLVVGRTVYRLEMVLGGTGSTETIGGIPGSSPVVACNYSGGLYAVALENGDAYMYCPTSCGFMNGRWLYMGNAFGTVTPAPTDSWGRVKGRYRK